MKLIGNLKKKVENAETREEARAAIKKAGMLLTDDELEKVSGGAGDGEDENYVDINSICPVTGDAHDWNSCIDLFDSYENRYKKQCIFCGSFTISRDGMIISFD